MYSAVDSITASNFHSLVFQILIEFIFAATENQSPATQLVDSGQDNELQLPVNNEGTNQVRTSGITEICYVHKFFWK